MTVWLSHELVLAIHDEQLAVHGGSQGIRGDGLLQSALARPLNRAGYGEPDSAELAALYAIAIARNQPFIDGNKRVGANAAITFLLMNDWTPTFGEEELVDLVLSVASGGLNKAGLTDIFESRCAPR